MPRQLLNFTAACLLTLAPVAQAHNSVSAGNATVEFHTDANELLRVNADTIVGFKLKIKDQIITDKDCKCVLMLYPGQPSARVKPIIIPLELDPDDPESLIGVVTVTQEGQYSLVLDGRPVTPGAFDSFRLIYPVKAAVNVFAAPPEDKKP